MKNNKLYTLILFMFFSVITSFGQQKEVEHVKHDIWNELLQKHVDAAGKVDYEGFKNEEARLDEYLELIGENEARPQWTSDERKAYWINAYNAFTIKMILEKYPVQSVKDVADKPFDKRFIKIGKLTHTLNEIENKILRKQFDDARIHFGINCGANSCPKLNNKAFTMFNVDKELDRLTKEFMISNNMKYEEKKGLVINAEISKIFEWYKEDFEKSTGSINTYIEKFSGKKFSPKVKVSYMDYDWGLNKQ